MNTNVYFLTGIHGATGVGGTDSVGAAETTSELTTPYGQSLSFKHAVDVEDKSGQVTKVSGFVT